MLTIVDGSKSKLQTKTKFIEIMKSREKYLRDHY